MVLNLLLRSMEIWLTVRVRCSDLGMRALDSFEVRSSIVWWAEFTKKFNISDTGCLRRSRGGTKLEGQDFKYKKFLDHFKEELKDQMKGNPRNKF
ncbi:hypothetical protein N7517_002441 [Penicillium concentricum]|uniref:Uncharacterized protein n=1 Tax=Penicillium concentricum TaxID=293559 RepID=A0A9W9STZ8_9EURO|nr:uncharacterized protein N7517_002441 [Penicillium concentricum]KAJ5384530.1 hypothetical protein N7517_002441 [Penicillium concentricum]